MGSFAAKYWSSEGIVGTTDWWQVGQSTGDNLNLQLASEVLTAH